MQLQLFTPTSYPQLTVEFFNAYFDCRRHKRNTASALLFEKHLERNLYRLMDEVRDGHYAPGRCIAFVVDKPVRREVFAADFRDRVVHHWLINKLNPLFENLFINDSYACRTGKGTHFGIRRLKSFIEECSENYSSDCHILKLDISGFFMHISRPLLFARLEGFIRKNYLESEDLELVIEITRKIIFNDPVRNCIIKGSKADWRSLPKNKSLFHSPPGCGLPIGNLTSQIFANFYLHSLDRFVTRELGVKYYGRYVDDFFVVHPNRNKLKRMVIAIRAFLWDDLKLTLHPDKIYMQDYRKGVRFLGAIVKPHRIYIINRTKGNFFEAVSLQNIIVRSRRPVKDAADTFLCVMNSYLGMLKHFNTYRLRKRIIFQYLSGLWFNYAYPDRELQKFALKARVVRHKK